MAMSFLPMVPEPLRMLVTNPSLFDFSSDGPISYVFRQKLTAAPPAPPALSLALRTVLVTGATSGVGLEAARQFLHLGAKLVLGVRNLDKGEQAKHDLLQSVSGGEVQVLELDLESFESVEDFVAKLKIHVDVLDIAVMNAGFFSRGQGLSSDGYNMLLQVNFLSTAYLSLLLLPLLRGTSTPGRLVLVSSEAHAWTTYDVPEDRDIFKSVNESASLSEDKHYYLAKLFLTLFGRELATRFDPATLVVVTTTPGFCASGLFRDSEGLLAKVINLTSARSLEYGGRTHVHAATIDAAEAHGQYFRDGHPMRLVYTPCLAPYHQGNPFNVRISRFARSEAGKDLQKRLWSELVRFSERRGVQFTI